MYTPTSLSQSLITPAPRIAARDDATFWGYYPTGSSIETLTCDSGNIFTSSGGFAGCYGTDYVASHSTLNYGCSQVSTTASAEGGIILCTQPSASCITQTIYQTFPFDGELIDYFCAVGGAWSAFTIYRDIPSASSSSSLSTSPTSNPTSTSNSLSTFTSSITPSSVTVLAPTTTITLSPSSSTPSNAWISGPIIGSIAIVALISFAIWYIWNRRRERNSLIDHRLSYNSKLWDMRVPPEPAGEGAILPQEAPTDHNRSPFHELS